MRLLLDEHYANEIAVELRRHGYDAVSVSERGLKGIAGEPLLELASAEGRALVTNNVREFLAITANWVASGRHHCGLLLTSDASMPRGEQTVGVYVSCLRELMAAHPAERALHDTIRWLP